MCRALLFPTEKLVFQLGHQGPTGTGSSVHGQATAPGLAVVSGALSQGLGSFPARGGKMEIALELFIYLYCTMFQKGLKKA